MNPPYFHNSTIDMGKTLNRKPFVTEKDGANPGRFDLSDFYDKSTYLTKVPRHRSILPFGKEVSRTKDLIDKGGDDRISLGGKSSIFYDTDKKFAVMKRLDRGIPTMQKVTKRVNHNSIYRRDEVPDYYDNLKVAETKKNITEKKNEPYIDMKKQ